MGTKKLKPETKNYLLKNCSLPRTANSKMKTVLLLFCFVTLMMLMAANASGSWTITTVDSIGDVGEHNAISIAYNSYAHISYYDESNANLKYATNASGSWVTSTIDSTGNVGGETSIAIDSGDYIHISYYDFTNQDLKYATNASGSWVTTTIDSTGNVGKHTSIGIDSSNHVHISYYDVTNGDLKYATNASGSWATSTIDSTGNVGGETCIAIDSGDHVHISYDDYTNQDLKYATNASGSWATSTIDSTGNVGDYTSIAIDSSDKIYISYYDGSNQDLKYATNASGSWVTSTIDSTGNVGRETSIAIDSNNKVYISYYDVTNGDLKYATNASGSWTTSTIDSAGNVGGENSIAIDSNNNVHISYYDYTNRNLKYASGTALIQFTITATAGPGGSISPSGAVSVNYSEDQSFTITPNANYHVLDVLVDGSSVGAVTSYTFTNIMASHTISASFAIDTHTITASAGAGGGISPSGAVIVDHGADQAFSITPIAGYHVADVLVDSVSVGPVASYTFTNVTTDHTISASFAINTYTISATAGANGSISPSGSVIVDHGANQSFTIAPIAGYHVADVLVDGSSVGAVTSYTFTYVTAGHTISASFAIEPLTITTSSPLPDGWVGTAYNQTLNATGGLTPYTWSITSGSLPSGLTLNSSTGVISGTPTTTGTSDFIVQVADSNSPPSPPAAKNFSITIRSNNVRIWPDLIYHSGIQEAYDNPALSNGDTMQCQALVFSGTVVCNDIVSFTLKGGYNPDFTSILGYTTIQGSLTITQGTVIVENIIIQ